MNKKAFARALVVAAVATGAYFLFSPYLAGTLDGTGPASSPQAGRFESAHLGIAFDYPDTYEAATRHEGEGHVVTLLPRGYVPPQNGEGPPAITVQEFVNAEGLPLEQFLQSEPRTNWNLVVGERGIKQAVVGGEPAIWYHYSGLYEVDSVAVAHGEKVYILSGDWLEPNDTTRADFNELIKTVTFI